MNNQFAGWFGEKATAWGLAQGLDPRDYHRIDDLIIPNGKGGTTQIDHVILSRFGLFVIETKNRSGTIYGTAESWDWQQHCNGKIFYFQNPMVQNNEHIRALARLLNLRWGAFFSIVFFCGDARFAQPMPFNVRTEGVTTVVHSQRSVILSPVEVAQAWHTLQACKRNGNLSAERHRRYVNGLRSKMTPDKFYD